MEQKDYILREIEKIASIVRAIRQKLFGGKDSLAINLEEQVEEGKGMLLSELDFDLDKALQLYELCDLKSKTFSMERERHIENIKKALYN